MRLIPIYIDRFVIQVIRVYFWPENNASFAPVKPLACYWFATYVQNYPCLRYKDLIMKKKLKQFFLWYQTIKCKSYKGSVFKRYNIRYEMNGLFWFNLSFKSDAF